MTDVPTGDDAVQDRGELLREAILILELPYEFRVKALRKFLLKHGSMEALSLAMEIK